MKTSILKEQDSLNKDLDFDNPKEEPKIQKQRPVTAINSKSKEQPNYTVISGGAKYNQGPSKGIWKSIFDDSEESKSYYNNIIEIADDIEKSFL